MATDVSVAWVLWGIPREQKYLAPVVLHSGVYEQVTGVQQMWRDAGWITGPYREGHEPKGLLAIQSSNQLDNARQTSETSPMTSGNYVLGQQETTRRAIKATAILAVLDRFELTAEQVEGLNDDGWQKAAQIAALTQKPEPADWADASPKTRAVVVATMRQREATPDPFQGFPQ